MIGALNRLCELGVIQEVPVLGQQINQLEEILKRNDGIFKYKLSHYYFNKWTPYLGMVLENDWKKKNARTCDLTFRSLLILKLSGKLNE